MTFSVLKKRIIKVYFSRKFRRNLSLDRRGKVSIYWQSMDVNSEPLLKEKRDAGNSTQERNVVQGIGPTKKNGTKNSIQGRKVVQGILLKKQKKA